MTERSELLGVRDNDNPSRLRIHWTDWREIELEIWFNKLDRSVAYVDIDGVRYMPARPFEESCEVLD